MNLNEEVELNEFYQQLIRPQQTESDQLLTNKNQVAGHAGFYSLRDNSTICLKPFNIDCVRGRREHLFYQLIEYFKRNNYGRESAGDLISEKSQDKECAILYYKHFNLLTYPNPATRCDCIIDRSLFKLLSSFVAKFYHVKHLPESSIGYDRTINHLERDESVYSQKISCACYGRNPEKKSPCSRDYQKVNFLCLEELTLHCREPCIIDIKIGVITYDPMALKDKVLEQSSKYRRLREFGFRILGVKLGDQFKDKSYGKALETSEQIYGALDNFLTPLTEFRYKLVVINKILERIQLLSTWFESKNINQLRFFSSSLLIVYDSFTDMSKPENMILEDLANNVRVSMIDFAHVFHVHNSMVNDGDVSPAGRDDNYLFGLRKLQQFFTKLNDYYQSLLHSTDPHLPLE